MGVEVRLHEGTLLGMRQNSGVLCVCLDGVFVVKYCSIVISNLKYYIILVMTETQIKRVRQSHPKPGKCGVPRGFHRCVNFTTPFRAALPPTFPAIHYTLWRLLCIQGLLHHTIPSASSLSSKSALVYCSVAS